jgi:hypothetical protein
VSTGPTWSDWGVWFGVVGIEILILAGGLAALSLAQRRWGTAVGQRAVWRAGLCGALLILGGEWMGVRQWLAPTPVADRAAVRSAIDVRTDLPPGLADWTTADLDPAVAMPIGRAGEGAPRGVWWPLGAWVVGTLLVGGRLALARCVFHRAIRVYGKGATLSVVKRTIVLMRVLGIRRPVQVKLLPGVRGPVAGGTWSPVVVLPEGFERDFSPATRDAMLLHELGHVAARDGLWHGIADLTSALLWWHPAVWWMRRRLFAVAELAADESSLLVPEGPRVLAECLVTLAGRWTSTPTWAAGQGMLRFRSGLGQRVERLLAMKDVTGIRLSEGRRWLVRVGSWMLLAGIIFIGRCLFPGDGDAASLRSVLTQQAFAAQFSTERLQVPDSSLITRWFRIDPYRVAHRLAERLGHGAIPRGPADSNLVTNLQSYLVTLGVTFNAMGKQLIWVKSLPGLMVRTTPMEMEIIEAALQELDTPPSQVVIETRFIEVPLEAWPSLASDWLAIPVVTNSGYATGVRNEPLVDKTDLGVASVLSAAQASDFVNWLRERTGISMTTAPRVTTLSGRQAQIKTVQVQSVVTGMVRTNVATGYAPEPVITTLETGPILDVIPSVLADGVTIHLSVSIGIKEFLGYDPAGTTEAPKPVYRERRVVVPIRIWDSQAAVIFGGVDQLAIVRGQKTAPPLPVDEVSQEFAQKHAEAMAKSKVAVLVTARIIDPAGNAVNREEQIPVGVPPQ